MPSSRIDKNLTDAPAISPNGSAPPLDVAAANGTSSNGAAANGTSSNGVSSNGAVANALAANETAPREYSQAGKTASPRLLGIADRYLFWRVVSGTLSGLMWFGGLLVLVSSINVLRKGLQQSLPFDAMLLALLYQLPRVFQFALPMSLLFGTVQTFSDLSSKSEITALWAGGMGLKRMLRAPLLWGALLGFTSFLIQEYVVPDSEFRSARVFEDRVKASLKTQSNFRYFDPPLGKGSLKLQILAERYDAKTGSLINPRVTIYYPDGSQKTTIDAQRGWGDEKTGLWKFYNGLIRFFPKGERDNPNAIGARTESHFPVLQNNLDGYGSVTAIKQAGDLRARHLVDGDFEMISMGDLLAYRGALEQEGGARPLDSTRRLISGATYGIHDKIATPLICLALILVGAPLGIRPPREKSNIALGLSFLVVGAYYMLWTLASYGGKDGSFNPLAAAYVALFATTSIGAFLLWKKNR